MPDSADDFGERAATAQEVADWKTLVDSGRNASRGYKKKRDRDDRMRPIPGSGKASSEA